jgi:hypothetical protein
MQTWLSMLTSTWLFSRIELEHRMLVWVKIQRTKYNLLHHHGHLNSNYKNMSLMLLRMGPKKLHWDDKTYYFVYCYLLAFPYVYGFLFRSIHVFPPFRAIGWSTIAFVDNWVLCHSGKAAHSFVAATMVMVPFEDQDMVQSCMTGAFSQKMTHRMFKYGSKVLAPSLVNTLLCVGLLVLCTPWLYRADSYCATLDVSQGIKKISIQWGNLQLKWQPHLYFW